jgi:tetratricopeptide (TPR) repeat protein
VDSSVIVVLLVGLAYAVIFGGLSLLRREGLSLRFAIESTVLTAAAAGLAALSGLPIHPILFLVVLYLLTMRVRLLVDLANILAQRGHFAAARRLYELATRLWPDPSGRIIVQVNQATACLQQGALDEAVARFKDVLSQANGGYLGVKHEAAAHYNLGLACRRKGLEAQAVIEFNAVLDTWPVSEYARHAQAALKRKT